MNAQIVSLLKLAEEALRDCLGGDSAAVYRNDPAFVSAMDRVEAVNRMLDESGAAGASSSPKFADNLKIGGSVIAMLGTTPFTDWNGLLAWLLPQLVRQADEVNETTTLYRLSWEFAGLQCRCSFPVQTLLWWRTVGTLEAGLAAGQMDAIFGAVMQDPRWIQLYLMQSAPAKDQGKLDAVGRAVSALLDKPIGRDS